MSQQPEENENLLNFIASTIEMIRDQMATKSDVARLEDKIEVGLTAVRGDIERVDLRLDSI